MVDEMIHETANGQISDVQIDEIYQKVINRRELNDTDKVTIDEIKRIPLSNKLSQLTNQKIDVLRDYVPVNTEYVSTMEFLGKRPPGVSMDPNGIVLASDMKFGAYPSIRNYPRVSTQNQNNIASVDQNNIENIVSKMEDAVGSVDKPKYWALREIAIKTRWRSFINFLKNKQSSMKTHFKYEKTDWEVKNVDGTTHFISLGRQAGATKELTEDIVKDGNFDQGSENLDFYKLSDKCCIANYFSVKGSKSIALGATGIGLWIKFIVHASESELIDRLISRSKLSFANIAYESLGGNKYRFMVRMTSWKNTASSWKFKFTSRFGFYDKLYKTLCGNMSFSGYNSKMTAETLQAKMEESWGDIIKKLSFVHEGTYISMTSDISLGIIGQRFSSSIEVPDVQTVHYIDYLSVFHNLARAFWGQRNELTKNSKNRMSRYLNKDKKDLNRLRNFIGS